MVEDNDIWEKLRRITKEINLGDILEQNVKPRNNNIEETLKFESKTRKGNHNRRIFLYLNRVKRSPKHIVILFNTGKGNTIKDPEKLTSTGFSKLGGRSGDWPNIPCFLQVFQDDLNSGKYTYADIKDLIKSSYDILI